MPPPIQRRDHVGEARLRCTLTIPKPSRSSDQRGINDAPCTVMKKEIESNEGISSGVQAL